MKEVSSLSLNILNAFLGGPCPVVIDKNYSFHQFPQYFIRQSCNFFFFLLNISNFQLMISKLHGTQISRSLLISLMIWDKIFNLLSLCKRVLRMLFLLTLLRFFFLRITSSSITCNLLYSKALKFYKLLHLNKSCIVSFWACFFVKLILYHLPKLSIS